MEINIDAKAVEQAVSDAIINSAIGPQLKKAVTELLGRSYDNPIQKAIERVVAEVALKFVRDNCEEQIREAVKKKIEDVTIAAMVDKFWQQVLNESFGK